MDQQRLGNEVADAHARVERGIGILENHLHVAANRLALDAGKLRTRTHPLLGRASLHASTISGGIGMSTYPDRCTLALERRTLPEETAEEAVNEILKACDRVKQLHPELSASVRLLTAQAPSDVAIDAPVVKALESALEAEGLPARVEGLSAWTDAALLNAAGIPAICFGPGDIALAHAAEEWVAVAEIERATAVLTRVAHHWMTESK